MCRRSRHSHAVETVWRLFETVSLSQVIINLTVFDPRVRSLAPRGDLPHGDSKRPLRDRDRERGERSGEEGERGEGLKSFDFIFMEITQPCLLRISGHPTLCTTYKGMSILFNAYTKHFHIWNPGPLIHTCSDNISCY